MALRRSSHRSMVLGALAGASIWAYDYDFFLNAGGPKAPLSTAILSASRLDHAYWVAYVFWPLAVLMAAGAGVGLAASAVLARVRGR